MKIATLTFVAALAVSGLARAASPFVGTWKMDAAKSNFTGDIMTYTRTASGYHVVNGAVSYDFVDDGKPYALVADRTVAWTKTPDGGWDLVYSGNGKTLTKAHRVLSADGTTLTTTYEEYRGDGSTVHETDVYTRAGGGSGLAGVWKSTKVDAAPESMVVSPAEPESFRIEYPANKVAFTAKLDGSPVKISGPTVPPGAMASFQKVNAAEWTYTNKLGEKVMGKGVMMVSPDGSTLTDTSWAPGKEAEKSVEVYDRQ